MKRFALPQILALLLAVSRLASADTVQEPYVDCTTTLMGFAEGILGSLGGGPLMVVKKDERSVSIDLDENGYLAGSAQVQTDEVADQDLIVLPNQYHGYGNKRVKGFYVFTLDGAYFYPNPELTMDKEDGTLSAKIRLDFDGKKSVYLIWRESAGRLSLSPENDFIRTLASRAERSGTPEDRMKFHKYRSKFKHLRNGDVWDPQARQAMAGELARRIGTVAGVYKAGPRSYRDEQGKEVQVLDKIRSALKFCSEIESPVVSAAIKATTASLDRIEAVRSPAVVSTDASSSASAAFIEDLTRK